MSKCENCGKEVDDFFKLLAAFTCGMLLLWVIGMVIGYAYMPQAVIEGIAKDECAEAGQALGAYSFHSGKFAIRCEIGKPEGLNVTHVTTDY